MKTSSALIALITGLLLAACGTPSVAPPLTAVTPAPTTAPAATAISTPMSPTAIATSAPTALGAVPTAHAITFRAADDVTLMGTIYGGGTTAIVLSNMGDNDSSAWEAFAPELARRGYTVLTYKFRYPTNSSSFNSGMANHTLDDLRVAIAFVRGHGAQKLVLVGASLGGMATAKAAAVEQPAAIVIIASPMDLSEFDFRVEQSELNAITAPKLFIGSEDDKTVPLAETQRRFDLSPDPKELQTYAGTAHGVHIFETDHGDDLRQRLIAFITSSAPPT